MVTMPAPRSRARRTSLASTASIVRVVVVDRCARAPAAVLEAPHEVEAAAPAHALLGVARVGDALQLLDDEARDEQLALQEAGLRDVERCGRR